MMGIDYKMESGASKKRRKQAEEKYWQSMNGPVLITTIEEER